MKRKTSAGIAVFALCFAILFTGIPGGFAAGAPQRERKQFGVIADPHFFPEELTDIRNEQFWLDTHRDQELMGESQAVLIATLGTIAARKANGTFDMDYLLMPGDLSYNGEKPGHRALAAILKQFELDTGIDVFVINGNHDINHYGASSYSEIPGKKITSRDNPELLLTKPEDFRDIYADFGYDRADSVYTPQTGKAGMMSYSAPLPGGYRLIAIDSCKYSADATSDGLDEQEGAQALTPGLLDWVLSECRKAESRGETIVGMAHGNIVEHFYYQSVVTDVLLADDFENLSYQLADAGMHFVFTGHSHSSDTAASISAGNEIIYDIETCSLIGYPNRYAEAAFDNTSVSGFIDCALDNIDCDEQRLVDIRAVSDSYGVIERPFRENFTMPVLYGGDIEKGKRNDALQFAETLFIDSIPRLVKKSLPGDIRGLLKENGIDFRNEALLPMIGFDAAGGTVLSPAAAAAFLDALVTQIDDKFINDPERLKGLARTAAEKLLSYKLSSGDPETELGKVLMAGMEGYLTGNESPEECPGLIAAAAALRTQSGADALVGFLLDVVLNDVLFDGILASIALDDLKTLLPAEGYAKLRGFSGGNLTAGALLDKLLASAAEGMNKSVLFDISSGRDLVKALVYAAGYKYLNAGARLKMTSAVADVLTTMTTDTNPSVKGDYGTVLRYRGKEAVVPTAENFRLPNSTEANAGINEGETVVTWYTMPGIGSTDCEIIPQPPAGFSAEGYAEAAEKSFTAADFGFIRLSKTRSLLRHSLTLKGLEKDTAYRIKLGDSEKGLMSEAYTLTIAGGGDISLTQENEKRFDLSFISGILVFVRSVLTVLNMLR